MSEDGTLFDPDSFCNPTIFGVTIFCDTIFGVPIYEIKENSLVNLTFDFFVFCLRRVQRKNKYHNWRQKDLNPRHTDH